MQVLQKLGRTVINESTWPESFACGRIPQTTMVICELHKVSDLVRKFLHKKNKFSPKLPVLFICDQLTIDGAVQLMRWGAADVIAAPWSNEQLLNSISRLLKFIAVDNTSRQPDRQEITEHHETAMIGTSSAILQIQQNISLVADTDISILISGESGTGKELAARAIHRHSQNPQASFIKVNCSAIPRDLLESELFGHVRGAFTGATAERQGAFFLADGGTIFLDEIGDMPLELQPKLLHAVEEKQISPVGTGRSTSVQVRIIAATNRDLEKMVENGTFRNDLFHRLNGFPLALPPLRERREDIPRLLHHFTRQFSARYTCPAPPLPDEVMQCFMAYDWPGNIRELRNLWKRLMVVSCGRPLSKTMLPVKMIAGKRLCNTNSPPMDLTTREKMLIFSALQQCNWNQSKSAKKLGITRNTLRYRMKKYDLSPQSVVQ